MLTSHSAFAPIKKQHFLVGTRVHAAWQKKTSPSLKTEYRTSARRFLEQFSSTVLSTAASRSTFGQGIGCLCPEVILGDDNYPPFFLFGQLLDQRIECGWEKGLIMEACNAKFQSFVQEAAPDGVSFHEEAR